jgi:formate-dependent nitrite reductase membrane component NrfD
MPPGAEHFVQPPQWEWWILGYFFLGGLAGGSYALGTLLRIAGDPRDETAARLAYIASFIALIPCPIFLALDLGQPIRFWHMLVDTSDGGLALNLASPMSVGSWVLLFFGLFSFVSFLGALAESGRLAAARPIASALRGGAGIVWGVIGTVLGVFICGYTGVLLAVSNQPVWSDGGWVLGGMFLASALSGSAALLLLLARSRRDITPDTEVRIEAADRMFVILEAILIALFIVTLILADTVMRVLGVWIVLWLVVLIGLAAPLVAGSRPQMARRWPPLAAPVLALIGVLALRALVIFSAQFG